MLADNSVRIFLGAVAAVGFLLVFASALHHRYHFTKKMFFTVLSGIVTATTAALVIINLQGIQKSEENGLTTNEFRLSTVVCGQNIEFTPGPSLLASSSGDANHYIFADGTFRYVGYRIDSRRDGSLGGFFRALGGGLSTNTLAIPAEGKMLEQIESNGSLQKFIRTNPTGSKYLELKSGDTCGDSSAVINVFTYEYSPTTHDFTQKKIVRSPEEYSPTIYRFSEPSCIVIVFDESSTRTDRTCGGYPDLSKVTVSGETL